MSVTFNSHDRPEPITTSTPLDELIAAELAAGIDGGDPDTLAMRDIPPDALAILIRFILGDQSRAKSTRWQVAAIRLAVIAHAIQLDGVGDLSFEELGRQLGCTRATISLYNVRLLDQFGISKFRSSKSRQSRDIYRETAIAAHRKLDHKLTGKAKKHKPFSTIEP